MGEDGLQRRFLLLPGLRSSRHPRLRHPARPALPPAAQDRRRGGAGRARRLLPPAHPALRSGRRLPDLPRRGRTGTTGRAASRCSTTTPSTSSAPGRPTAGRSTWPTTPGGTSTRTSLVSSEWGTPSMIEDGLVPELLLGPEVRPLPALLGPRRGPAPADGRPRRRAPDGAGAAALPRPGGDLGVRRRRGLDGRPVRVGVAVAPRRGPSGRSTRSSRSRPSPPTRPTCRRRCSRSAPCRRWSPTSTCPSTTRCSTCPAGAPASSSSTTCPTRRTRARSGRCGSAGSSGASAHPAAPDERLAGGPQMVEVSRDGRRIYVTNSLYGAWDDQFYPDGVGAWMAKIDTDPSAGGLSVDERFFPHGERVPRPAGAPGAAAGRRRVLGLVLLPVAGRAGERRGSQLVLARSVQQSHLLR